MVNVKKKCKWSNKRFESAKRKAEDVKRTSKSVITFNEIVTLRQRALNSKRQRLESNSLIAECYSKDRTETDKNPPFQHVICDDPNPESYSNANNEHFDTDSNSDGFDLYDERCENPIRKSGLNDEKAVQWLLSVNRLQRHTLTYQKDLEDKLASVAYRGN